MINFQCFCWKMASHGKKYPEDFFKKEILSPVSCHDESQLNGNFLEEETSSESEMEIEFNSEDKQISRLYRRIVDDVMAVNKLRESTVDVAIHEMMRDIHQGHKTDFRKFAGIDFGRPENRCGYLRRYGICHTGLVKKSLWNFFTHETDACRAAMNEIVNNNHLRIVSLGGGPGNDIVGFCSALEEIPNSIEELELIVIDIDKGWKSLFPKLLRKAKYTDSGSFSQCLQKKITTGFMEADLTDARVYRDKNLSLVLGRADVLLMVKLTSFLCFEEADTILRNVIDCMKQPSKLIFIDQHYDGEFFSKIESLDCIYLDSLSYKLNFNPRKSHSLSIESAYAHVAILQKKLHPGEDFYVSEDL